MTTEKMILSVAEYKAMLEAGFPIQYFRELKKKFSWSHYTPDALDYKESAADDALYYSNFMHEFRPSSVVPPSKTTFELPRALDPSFGDVTFSDVNGKALPPLSEYVNARDPGLQSLIMIHRGRVVYEVYPGMRPTDVHIWQSVTKPITGTLVVDLVMNGKMDPKAPITQYVPELKGSAWDGVPLQAVLNMTTGLDGDDIGGGIFGKGGVVQRFYLATFGDSYNGKQENWLEVIRETKKIDEPHTVYRYASMNTQVLSVAVENVTQKKFVDHAYDRLFQYTGSTEMRMTLLPDGSVMAASSMNSTLEDLARFGLLFTPTYKKLTGKEVISRRHIDHLFATKVPKDVFYNSAVGQAAVVDLGNQTVSGSSSQFDFLWEDGALGKLGHNNQGLYIDPAREFVGAYFSESVTPNYPIGYLRAAALSLK